MFEDKFINVGPIKTRFWQTGASGSTVLLLHGIGCSVLEWERNIEALAAHHRVFALDLMGFGLTDKPVYETYSIDRLAQFILEFMNVMGVARAHLVGHSLGGRLALECAANSSARVSSLLLVGPAGIDRGEVLLLFRLASLPVVGEISTWPNRAATRMLWRKVFYAPSSFVTDQFVETKHRLARLPGARLAFLKTLRGFVDSQGFCAGPVAQLHAVLPSMRTPTLALWGREDQFVPCDHAEVLRRMLPDVEAQIWEQCGHAPHIEYSQRFNEVAVGFWRRVDSLRAQSSLDGPAKRAR